MFVTIAASDGERLGTLCLLRGVRSLSAEEEKHVLQALASHAALSLENFRRFSQLERSKRQWVEDIDAISDYIVVHDRSLRIVRTNRSLASHLGVPPVALVGEADEQLAADCRNAAAIFPARFAATRSRRAKNMSSRRRSGFFWFRLRARRDVSDDDTRTIHVLKDMTDRREAERRYRELFDSIQEGLFFATPDGRFLDVNDAMVRMLGYDSREELLRADVGPHLYPVPGGTGAILSGARGARSAAELRRDAAAQGRHAAAYPAEHHRGARRQPASIAQIRGLMLDVTEQRTFQSQLQRERDFNQKILNTTQSMILVLDTAGLISYANRRCYEIGLSRKTI